MKHLPHRNPLVWISLLTVFTVAAFQGCPNRRPRPIDTGGEVSGSLYYLAAVQGPDKFNFPIFLPDIEVYLHNARSGTDTTAVTTDLFGRYRFRNQSPGTYELRWKAQRGWAAGRLKDLIVIRSGPRFPVSGQILPHEGGGVIFGRITLGDGGTPWSYDELFNVNHTATVTILNVARTEKLSGPLNTNSEGLYAAAGLPRSQPTSIRAQSQAAIITRGLDGSRVSMGNPVIPTDLQLANKSPEIISLIAQVGGTRVQTANPGDTITIVAGTRDLNNDPLQHEWITANGHGTVTPSTAGSAKWTLPNQVGGYSTYVQVSDGRGGFARQRIDFITARTTTTFAGVAIEKGTTNRLKDAAVVVNG